MSGWPAVVALATVAACSAAEPARPGVDVGRVVRHVEMLAATIGPRVGDTPAAREAARYVEAALGAAGVSVERRAVGEVDVPPIAVGPLVFAYPRKTRTEDVNLLVRFAGSAGTAGTAGTGPGAGPGALLLMAHYDSVAGAPGAIDNAVAVGVLVELAGVLARDPPPQPVWLAFTAREEDGLLGARKLAAELGDQVALAVSLDLLGTDGPLIVNGAGALIRGGELRWLAERADAAGVDLAVPWPHRIVSRWWPQIERSDHGPFTARGVRAIHLFHRGADGESIYLAYHTPRDAPEQVSRAAVAELGRLVRALAMRPPPAPAPAADAGVWLPVPGNVVVPRWSLLAACGALIVLALIGAIASRRAMAPGPGLLVALALWIAAAAVALAIEHLAAGAHPAPWVHAPLAAVIALGLVLFGAAGLGVALVARWRAWGGRDRYATAAALWNLVVGIGLLAIGAAELAWLWLAPAALLAWAPRFGVAGIAMALVAVVPGLAAIGPDFLREGVFHGFVPLVPLSLVLAVVLVTPALVLAHLAARVRVWGPGASLVVPAVAAAAILAGVVLALVREPACTANDFARQRLACELLRR